MLIVLPPPRTSGSRTFEEAVRLRRSVRSFTGDPLSLEDQSQLLWSAQGITSSDGMRAAPSAGATFPIEIYTVSADGVSHYVPDGHRIDRIHHEDLRERVSVVSFGQEAVARAAMLFVVGVIASRTEQEYGDDAARYVDFEVGHLGQNLLLQAVALGLGGLAVGAFEKEQLHQLLGLPPEVEPAYMIAVGHPV